MNKLVQLISILGIATFVMLSPVTVHAEDEEQRITELEQQVTELQEQVAVLQKQVAALQPQPKLDQNPGEDSIPETAGNWDIRANWEALETGMTKKSVLQLLGDPEFVRSMPYGHNWFYKSGYVMFDHTGRLKRWSEPL